jgi:phosphohistidine phosphatase
VKTLLLLRHAKSAWSDPKLDDHDRPLNGRGERAAKAVADHIAGQGLRPDLILCSTAIRTRQTLAPLIKRLGTPAPPISLESGLYLASEVALLARLQAVADDVPTLLLIGHNDGIGQLAADLAGSGPPEALSALREKYPTGALAVLGLRDGPWSDLQVGSAVLLNFVRPRDLAVT